MENLIGDFNELLSQGEKKGGLKHPKNLIQGFRKAAEDCNLVEVNMLGHPFNWERSRGQHNWFQQKLDKALVNQNCANYFPMPMY